ncbi:MAG: hypothetical protein ACKUBY_05920 [Candidatus Moraniibacteriota bacterium]|jgi:hypothetical protein
MKWIIINVTDEIFLWPLRYRRGGHFSFFEEMSMYTIEEIKEKPIKFIRECAVRATRNFILGILAWVIIIAILLNQAIIEKNKSDAPYSNRVIEMKK